MTLADALVHDPAGQGGDAHWNEEAKALIAGLIVVAAIAIIGAVGTKVVARWQSLDDGM